jgi:hypothetical protein
MKTVLAAVAVALFVYCYLLLVLGHEELWR